MHSLGRFAFVGVALLLGASLLGCKKPKSAKLRSSPKPPATEQAAAIGPASACFFGEDKQVRCAGQGPWPGVPASPGRAVVVPALAGATEIALSERYGCARFGSVVRCWGQNEHHVIAEGPAQRYDEPFEIAGDARAITVTPLQMCVLAQSGQIRCRGTYPAAPATRSTDWYNVGEPNTVGFCVSRDVMCAFGSGADTVTCWGATHPTPMGKPDLLLPGGKQRPVRAVACGRDFALALAEDGTAYEWRISTEMTDGAVQRTTALIPVRNVARVAGPRCVVLQDGRVLCAPMTDSWTGVAPMQGIFGVVDVVHGPAGTLFLTRDGGAYAWGANAGGALGVPEEPLSVPTPVFLRQ